MPNGNSPREGLWSFRNNSDSRFNAYGGANTGRQSRFEARSARRWGDWGVLGVPLPLLWLEEGWGLSLYDDVEDEVEFVRPALVDLWP